MQRGKAFVEQILTLSCADRPGIVGAVASLLAAQDYNIIDSAQFGDSETGRFFMRVHFMCLNEKRDIADLRQAFAKIADAFAMAWQIRRPATPTRTLILVSRFDHCLHDLLYRRHIGELNIDIRAVVSNHEAVRGLVNGYGLAFHHWPVEAQDKADQEARLRALIDGEQVELVVLARYMQILSAEFCAAFPGRIINIHHSFLPSFKGARPYQQAHGHGVKLIGATAHFVTAQLDEGPIIEQDVTRVDHSFSVAQMVAAGRDVERLVLSRAVRAFAERRILLNGRKTVVLR
jgi:formyltetrahydrofolate deformylase